MFRVEFLLDAFLKASARALETWSYSKLSHVPSFPLPEAGFGALGLVEP